ncbi:pituitary tumor-transforming gene 1 protein-interacting protein isoform X1 [Heterocephalus glaber]|uniref:Pituitary tumor-transforming gene 1 protein-interacting protein isoform X1 n=1 Tax=Heterocephalus glaber TaxID=10181 RepID=A0AAX6SU94_HETGA|nr:pituitary tumor-transforming gene 1 protein-interacting protein isoform X1 [Heterocephalus glaber]
MKLKKLEWTFGAHVDVYGVRLSKSFIWECQSLNGLQLRSCTRIPRSTVEAGDSRAVWFGGCAQNTNTSCEECLKNVSCLWCNTNKACLDYPVRKILPPASLCKLSSARWGICWVNFEALIITMSVLGGSIILGIAVACCCCCCRRKRSRKPDKSDERAMREQEERRVRQEERRAEMKSRHDEIRRKYGLFKEKNPYEKFQNN